MQEDRELNLEAPKSDLHSMRVADQLLDQRCFEIQKRAVDEAARRLRRDEFAMFAGNEAIQKQRILITGASGYLGAALAALLHELGASVVGLDLVHPGAKTRELLGAVPIRLGSVNDVGVVKGALWGDMRDESVREEDVECKQTSIIFHTAAMHAPHATHCTVTDFVQANVDSVDAVVSAGPAVVVATSTTSHTITRRVKLQEEADQCVWLDDLAGREYNYDTPDDADAPRNKYGRTKREAERRFVAHAEMTDRTGPAIVVLRAPRFFCEDLLEGSDLELANAMANELLTGRRAALADIVVAHVQAAVRAATLHGRILTLAAPALPADDLACLRAKLRRPIVQGNCGPSGDIVDTPDKDDQNQHRPTATEVATAVAAAYGGFDVFAKLALLMERQRTTTSTCGGWQLPKQISRVYDSSVAMDCLSWQPEYTFDSVLQRLRAGDSVVLDGLY